jgi:ankyrin repeat protein
MWSSQGRGIEYSEEVTLLHIAALFWNLEVMRALIDHRSDIKLSEIVSIADNEGQPPLH